MADTTSHVSIDKWIPNEALPFDLDSSRRLDAAIDKTVAELGDAVELLGFGEPLHGGEEFLSLRNRLFQRLVETHGIRAIAIESSYSQARTVNDYITSSGPGSYEEIEESGFSHGFGQLDANRDLVEWMRQYNEETTNSATLRFYGMDMPTEANSAASPRHSLTVALEYLSSLDGAAAQNHREQIESLLGNDAEWEHPEAWRDPSKAIGLSSDAAELRIATEDLATELRIQRPDLVKKSSPDRYREALHHVSIARHLLNYHAAVAAEEPPGTLLGIRDSLMAENVAHIAEREEHRGTVLVFAHNSHLQRSKAVSWSEFWPVGSHLDVMFGSRYAVIGSALGVSAENEIGEPEAQTLEARLASLPDSGCFLPTNRGEHLAEEDVAELSTRSGSSATPGYDPLTAESITDFDCFAFLRSVTYTPPF